jgi:hypothetical protein
MATEEEDFTSGTLDERLASSKWKARQHAYAELTKRFVEAEDDADSVFKSYASSMKKIIYDTNQIAQEKGQAAVLAWADRAPAAPRYYIQCLMCGWRAIV